MEEELDCFISPVWQPVPNLHVAPVPRLPPLIVNVIGDPVQVDVGDAVMLDGAAEVDLGVMSL